jgi:FlaA1/EpsC-like NDP-sugar epimerase
MGVLTKQELLQDKMNSTVKKLMKPSSLKRVLFFLATDLVIAVLSLYISFLIYFELHINVDYVAIVREVLPVFVALKITLFVLFKTYRVTWRYFGIVDLFNIIMALGGSSALLVLASLPWSEHAGLPFLSSMAGFPKSVIFMDFTVSLVFLSFLRISKRFYLEVVRDRRQAKAGKRTVIIGAGNTGEMVLRDMQRSNQCEFSPVGFLDDDDLKTGAYIHGVRVLGNVQVLEDVIEKYEVEAIVIAIPSLHRKLLGQLYALTRRMNIGTVKIVPRIYDFNKPHIDLRNLEDISVEDLVGRQSVTVNNQEICEFVKGKRILITGAGGSIGSEIAIQACSFNPARLVLFDIDETDLHNLC